ncbi:ankyrin repeat domain-containing protein [Candidatus Babela massiliensis]|uniref:Ankyrin repeats containing protein n=1 Tax=Candidatus Babela massiliensis TaxID=673862 RepID=V6DG88_9BACT|nr:ankyrin repeat domain-containing protein [Candidatus Babela massiliensis]CDK30612.1 Ankyrin repeats containing protein [Candidatus Babela massiliensis]
MRKNFLYIILVIFSYPILSMQHFSEVIVSKEFENVCQFFIIRSGNESRNLKIFLGKLDLQCQIDNNFKSYLSTDQGQEFLSRIIYQRCFERASFQIVLQQFWVYLDKLKCNPSLYKSVVLSFLYYFEKEKINISGLYDNAGQYLLIHLIKTCNLEGLKMLIKKLDVNIVDDQEDTPLIWAIRLCIPNDGLKIRPSFKELVDSIICDPCSKEVLKFILNQENLNINQKNVNGDTALIKAILQENEELVRMLINRGADINIQNNTGNSPLIIAVDNGYISISQMLLQHGADINMQNRDGDTALIKAVTHGYKELVDILIANKSNVNMQNNTGNSPLIIAVDNGYTSISQMLLQHGAAVNMQNRDGDTALIKAITHGYKELVDILIANKSNVNMQNNIGDSPLVIAINKGFTSIAQALVENGGDIYLENKSGECALTLADQFGNENIIEMIESV